MARRFGLVLLLSSLASALVGCGGGGGSAPTGTLSGNLLGSPTPVSGARVVIEELERETRSTALGFFKFEGVPVGSYTVRVDGTQVFDPDDSSVQLPRKAVVELSSVRVDGGGTTTTLNDRPVFLPTLDTGTQIDTGGGASGTIPAGTVITNADFGVALVFDQTTTVTFEDPSETTVSVSEVAIGEVPIDLPSGQIASSFVTLQPPGATFSPGAKIVYANWNELPAGTTDVALYRFDRSLGDWLQFGTGTVDAEGESVVSDAGSEITSSGWNGPTTPVLCTTTVTGRIVDTGSPAAGIEGIRCTTINGMQATSGADGTFTIDSVPVPRPGFQVLVYGAPLAANSGYGAAVSAGTVVVCSGTTNVGDIALPTISADTTAPSVASVVPAAAATDVSANASIRVTFSENVSPGSVTPSNFQVAFGSGPIAGAIGVNGAEITFVPTTAMPLDEIGTITVQSAVQDAAGNTMAERFTSTFTTAAAVGGSTVTIGIAGTATVQQGGTTQLSASMQDATGSPVGGPQFSWSSDEIAVASVSRTGLVRGRSPGTVTITATSGSFTGTRTVTVTTPSIGSVVVTPSTQSIVVGSLRQFGAIARDAMSATIPGVAFDWTSSNPAAATIDAAGTLRAVGAGMTTITATAFGVSATAVVSAVAASSVATIGVTPTAAQADVGGMVQFAAIARDGSGNVIPGVPFEWTSSDTAIATVSSSFGQATSVATGTATITATSNSVTGTATLNVAQPTALTVALRGGTMTTDPLASVRVLRHDPTTGAFLDERTTTVAGIAAFGDIGASTTTFTIFQSIGNSNVLTTYAGVPTGTYSLVVDSDVANAATFDVILNGAGMSASSGELIVGDYLAGTLSSQSVASGAATFTNVRTARVQPNGKVTLVATAADPMSGTVTGTGWLLDQTPTSINGMTLSIVASSAPTTVPFSSLDAVRSAGYVLRRGGALFDIRPHWGATLVESGSVPVAGLPGVDAWALMFDRAQTSVASGMKQDRMFFGSLPTTSVTVAMPNITISSLGRNASTQAISWTAGGTNATDADFAVVELHYAPNISIIGDGGSSDVEWTVVATADTGSVTLPALPSNMSPYVPGADGVGYGVELVDLDNATDYATAIDRLEDAAGDLAALSFGSNIVSTAMRSNPAVTISMVNVGGTGSVTSSPAGIDTAMGQSSANFPAGTEVTLTITADSGSAVQGVICPGSQQARGGVSTTTCTFHVEEPSQTVVVFFASNS